MGIPQVPGQVRHAPILALRAVFAGIGRIVMSADRPDCSVTDETGQQAIPPPAASAPALSAPTQPSAAPAHILPLADYDSLTLPSIRARLRSLDAPQLKVLLDYEAANAERPEILRMYERRIEKIESGQ